MRSNYITSVTTNDAGLAYVTGLETGYYTIREVTPPEGYTLNTEEQSVYVDTYDPATTDDPRVTFKNNKTPQLRILKYDAQTRQPLANVTFEVYRDTQLIGTYTTNVAGEIYLYDLDPGTYLVKEVSAPNTHVVNSTPQQIELKEGVQNYRLTFLNYLKPGMYLVKLDLQTMQPLQNVRFRVSQVGGGFSREYLTDQNGEVKLDGLTPGAYEVEELEAPAGYLIDEGKRVIQLNEGENAQFVFTDTKKPTFRLIKRDSMTGAVLPGASFRISRIQDGARYLDRVTDINGEILVEDLEPGVYSVQELKAPEGYIPDPREYHVQLVPGRQAELVVDNDQKPDLKIVKRDADTGALLPGCLFKINKVDGSTMTTGRTDENGEVYLENLDPGVYQITEVAPPIGYLPAEEPTQLITLEANKLGTAIFENHVKPGLTILKRDSITGDFIKHVKFQVTYGSNQTFTGEIRDLGYFYTDDNGQIYLDNLQDGWYRVKEIEPAAGYQVKDTDTLDFFMQAGESKIVEFENTPLSAIVIKKLDQTGRPLQGAWFRVRFLGGTSGTGGTIIGEYETSANGTIVLTGLKAGTYIAEEITAPEGYILGEDDAQTAYISGKEQDVIILTFSNKEKGSVLIKKLDASSHAPISGVKFLLTLSDGTLLGDANGYFTTDSAGTILVDGLDPNVTVIAKEVEAKAGYVLDDTPQSVKIKTGTTVSLEFLNKPKGSVLVKKTDAGTGAPLSSAEFLVTTSDGTLVGGNNGVYTTDASGTFTVTGVEPGTTLIIKETKAPQGYILSDAVHKAVVKSGETVTVSVTNERRGSLQILKKSSTDGKPLEGVSFRVTTSEGTFVAQNGGKLSSNGIYKTDKNGQFTLYDLQPGTYVVTELETIDGYTIDEETRSQTVVVNTDDLQVLTFYNRPLGGIRIIKSDEDTGERLKSVRFEIRKMDGAYIGEYTTDRNGVIDLPGMEKGWYTITELKAADGYKLDPTPVRIEVKDGEMATAEIRNTKMSSILIHKIDSVTKRGIYGVKFVLYNEGRNPIGEYTSDQDGYVYIRQELQAGKYYLRELQQAAGYALDTEYKTVYVERGKTSEITWENTPVTGQIQVRKYADGDNAVTGILSGAPLQGAVYEITQARSGAVVGYIVTDAHGVAASSPLPLGGYFVTEVTAPAYYQLNPERMEAEIEYPGQIIKLSSYDKPVKLGVTIQKVGNKEVMPGNTMWYDFSNISNTSNVALNNFYWRDRILTDAVEAISITTGTYNQRLYYRVMFKTNLNDYRQLASNLLSTTNYSLRITPEALGLAQGEYVTDIRYEFGTVASGFASSVKPTMQVLVKSTVGNGYQIINRADVGGQYLNEWQTAQTSWITIVYRIQDNTPLPKTGY